MSYPVLEAIQSIEPLCDEVIINVGFDDPSLKKDDGTYDYLRDHLKTDKYKFLKSYWDQKSFVAGKILAQQTDIALAKCTGRYCQYIQADECLHELDLPIIENDIKVLEKHSDIHGLLFNYTHFYGNSKTIKFTRNTYKREIRLIKNNSQIKSWGDAQGFRYTNNLKIPVFSTSAHIYHYGWCRLEKIMDNKIHQMNKLYRPTADLDKENFKYKRIWGLRKFKRTHPKVMQQWIQKNDNDLDISKLPLNLKFKDLSLILTDFIEYISNYRIGEYKNFRLKKP